MKYFQILLLLGINFSTILLGQSIRIPHKMIEQDATINIPISIQYVDNLESIQLTIEYDDSIILAENIIENPLGILDGGYTFITNDTELGRISLIIYGSSANLFSGSVIVAQISFQAVGQLGDFSPLTFSDAQINSELVLETAIDGSIEIILDELTITAVDQSGIGSNNFIKLGMCETCIDGWRYGEDEYDNPNPQSAYTDIYFFNLDWYGQTDINDNTCDQVRFSTDYRQQHSTAQLISWGISGITSELSSDTPIILGWDSFILNSSSDNFKMYIYVGDQNRVDMQLQNSITISQSDLTLNANDETNIKVLMGICADTGITDIYYEDKDGDGLGWDDPDGVDDGVEYCTGFQPEGLVTNSDDTNDEPCNGDLDCSGVCGGTLVEDICGVCGGDGSDDLGCGCFEPGPSGCDNQCNSTAETDCSGVCGGGAVEDECGVCGGEDHDGDGICDIQCADYDCNGVCGGTAVEDECGV